MLSQKFNVVPQGIIKSGQVEYTVDETTGAIVAKEDIVAGVAFFTKELAEIENAKMDPSLLLSSALKKGMKLQMGSVSLEVINVSKVVATLEITINDKVNNIRGDGPAHLDLTHKYWSILDLKITGQVIVPVWGPIDLVVELEPVVE